MGRKWPMDLQMGYVGAELDLGPIDKVDVRNELRQFTILSASEVDIEKFASYSNLCV